MKTTIIVLLFATAIGVLTSCSDDDDYNYPAELAECGKLTAGNAIDLGLSVKWASCNVGASSPEEYGGYFAWGETEEKTDYSWDTYLLGSAEALDRYNTLAELGEVDAITVLSSEDDAATVVMGESWRTPTLEEVEELINCCTWYWTNITYTEDDKKSTVYGYKVVGNNGNSIFLPAAGYCLGTGTYRANEWGNYWTSTLSIESDCATPCLCGYYLSVARQTIARGYYYNRSYGFSVRGVQ